MHARMLSLALITTLIAALQQGVEAFCPKNLNLVKNVKCEKWQRGMIPEALEIVNHVSLGAKDNFLLLAEASTYNPSVSAGFSVATFLPQPFWLLMVAFPKWKYTKEIMGKWYAIVLIALVHFFIVATSISEPNGTAPLAEFTGVFDPTGAPLSAMMGMMKYPNFVSEEWSHVLAWDLFIGQYIWLDGLRRGVFTSHSVLMTNFIGPPGLLLHFLTCIATGKGLPPLLSPVVEGSLEPVLSDSVVIDKSIPAVVKRSSVASDLIVKLFPQLYDKDTGLDNLLDNMSDEVVWEDLTESAPIIDKTNVTKKLSKLVLAAPKGTKMIIDRVGDGDRSSGFAWHMEVDGVDGIGIRGTIYIELDDNNKIAYVCEGIEPLYKPGDSTSKLLKAVTEANLKKNPELLPPPRTYQMRKPVNANDMVNYMWKEGMGSDQEDTLSQFADSIVYEDYNFPKPFIGLEEVRI